MCIIEPFGGRTCETPDTIDPGEMWLKASHGRPGGEGADTSGTEDPVSQEVVKVAEATARGRRHLEAKLVRQHSHTALAEGNHVAALAMPILFMGVVRGAKIPKPSNVIGTNMAGILIKGMEGHQVILCENKVVE